MIQIYCPNHYKKGASRGELFPLLKAFYKEHPITDKKRIELYGVSDKQYCFVESIEECEIVILPMSWNYYYINGLMKSAEDVVYKAKKHSKQVYSYMSGDFGVVIPEYENCIVLRPNGYRSELSRNHIGIPVFIEDPFTRDYVNEDFILTSGISQPKVGFCGQVNDSKLNSIKETINVAFRNLKFYLKIVPHAPQAVISSSSLRNKALSLVKEAPNLEDQFIERKKYRAGVKTQVDRDKTTQEFYDNIFTSEYTICVRGGGNFSVRFYETLAMGRIPIVINTDCLFPLSDQIDWNKHSVWLEESELNSLPEKLLAFHSKLSTSSRNQLMSENRKLWETKLSMSGFFKSLLLTK